METSNNKKKKIKKGLKIFYKITSLVFTIIIGLSGMFLGYMSVMQASNLTFEKFDEGIVEYNKVFIDLSTNCIAEFNSINELKYCSDIQGKGNVIEYKITIPIEVKFFSPSISTIKYYSFKNKQWINVYKSNNFFDGRKTQLVIPVAKEITSDNVATDKEGNNVPAGVYKEQVSDLYTFPIKVYDTVNNEAKRFIVQFIIDDNLNIIELTDKNNIRIIDETSEYKDLISIDDISKGDQREYYLNNSEEKFREVSYEEFEDYIF